MGWLRLVGSINAEYSLFYRALLQKKPIILRSLLIVATAYPVFIPNINNAILCKMVKCSINAEYRLFYRALLQNRPIILRSLLIVATSYQVFIPNINKAPDICVRLSSFVPPRRT